MRFTPFIPTRNICRVETTNIDNFIKLKVV